MSLLSGSAVCSGSLYMQKCTRNSDLRLRFTVLLSCVVGVWFFRAVLRLSGGRITGTKDKVQ